jgi:hypothetical protein
MGSAFNVRSALQCGTQSMCFILQGKIMKKKTLKPRRGVIPILRKGGAHGKTRKAERRIAKSKGFT